jgi:hypothetical protein
MKKIELLIFILILGVFGLTGCSDDGDDAPLISPLTYELGSDGDMEQIMVPVGTDVAYKFSVKASAGLKKVELWSKEGLGINAEESKILRTWNTADFINGFLLEVSDTIDSLSYDVQYSVYVQDLDDHYATAKVNCFLDVMRYTQTLTDGATAATSATFLNLESGRSFFIANTIGDPAGMNMGFTYMENTSYQACLVAFDEYYKTGNYAMVVNDLNPTMTFRNASGIVTVDEFENEVIVASDLKSIYDSSIEYASILNFTAGKIVSALEEDDIIAFQAEDGRYGILKVNEIDSKDESIANNQTISLDVIVTKTR